MSIEKSLAWEKAQEQSKELFLNNIINCMIAFFLKQTKKYHRRHSRPLNIILNDIQIAKKL